MSVVFFLDYLFPIILFITFYKSSLNEPIILFIESVPIYEFYSSLLCPSIFYGVNDRLFISSKVTKLCDNVSMCFLLLINSCFLCNYISGGFLFIFCNPFRL